MLYVEGTNPAVIHRRGTDATITRIPPRRSSNVTRASAPTIPLLDIVENAILPRLMTAHGVVSPAIDPRAVRLRQVMDVDAIVPLAMNAEADDLLAHVEQLLRQGATIDSIFVDLLAPAARHLGLLWEDDRCDFVEVTMGLWRLQEVVRELAARVPTERERRGGGHRILCAAMPGDQHSFGTVIIDEMFRREGWATEVMLDPATSELIEHVAGSWFDVVGLTVSCDCNIAPLSGLIHAVRSVSRNPQIIVMVGGRVFVEDPASAIVVGADGTAADAVQAVIVAETLVRAVARELAACG